MAYTEHKYHDHKISASAQMWCMLATLQLTTQHPSRKSYIKLKNTDRQTDTTPNTQTN